MQFILGLLLGLFLTFINNALYDIAKHYFIKKVISPDSPYHYKKVLEELKALFYTLQVIITLSIFNLLTAFGFGRKMDKELEEKLTITLVLILIVVIVSSSIIRENKKQEPACS